MTHMVPILGHKIETLFDRHKTLSHHNKTRSISHQISRNLQYKRPNNVYPEVSEHVDDASPEVSEHEESSPVAPAKEEASVASTTIDGFCNVKQDAKFGYRRPGEP
jgi:hypothetical protein